MEREQLGKESEVPRLAGRFHNSRLGRFGMVAAAHPLAALAGLDALREGGNAMDACVTMAAVTSVVLPQMCGLGGDAFFLYYDAKNRRIRGANGSGPAGNRLTLDFVKQHWSYDPIKILPQDGIFSVAVPGAPLIYESCLKEFGTFDLKRAFQPGILLAREGFPVSLGLSRAIWAEREKLKKYREIIGQLGLHNPSDENCDSYSPFLPGGNAPKAGHILVQKELARTLEEFAQEGAEFFYKGSFAQNFMRLNERLGGAFDGIEFEEYLDEGPFFYSPPSVDYRDYTIFETAPVSQGFMVLEEMKILESFDLASMDPMSEMYNHILAQAKMLAFSDRNLYAGDPRYTGFNAEVFFSRERAQKLRERIRLSQIGNPDINQSVPEREGDTTSFVATDRWGNACSFIHSIAFTFGSGLIVPGTGVFLNNRAGRSFWLEEGHPNCVAPGKKPMHTLNCYMVFPANESRADCISLDKPFIIGGTPGGDGQPQWNMQMLCLMLDHGLSPQDACDFPRWLSFPGTDVLNLGKPLELRMESRFPEKTMENLRRLGHVVRQVGPWAGGGGAQVIMVDPESGVLLGGSDKRVEGMSIGY